MDNPVALLGRHDMHVADAGNGADRPLAPDDHPALVGQRLVEPAAQHLHRQEPGRRHAPDDAAQLVHVRIEHDSRPAAPVRGDDGAEPVIGDAVAERFHFAHHNAAHLLLEPRRPRRVGESAEQALDAVARLGRGSGGKQQGGEQEGQRSYLPQLRLGPEWMQWR